MSLLAACGDDGGEGPADAGLTSDAPLSIADAAPGTDAPEPDARGPTGDILADLRAIPGMTVTEQSSPLSGYRYFTMTYSQPVDHHDPGGARYNERLSLLHKASEAPMVLYTYGYDFSATARSRFEPTVLVSGNQLAAEHRFFGSSNPDPLDWSKLDIWQAANDHHRVVTALKPLYAGKWLNTGASKDGMTAVYHRRFFPDDVDGTIAYVAPLSLDAPDPRYTPFIEQAGSDPTCRQKLRDFQRVVLSRRAQLEPMMASSGEFDILGLDVAFEHVTLELPFGFWQYRTAASCASIPGAAATNAAVFDFLEDVGQIGLYADSEVERYYGYYYQAGMQLGWPEVNEEFVSDLLNHPGTDNPAPYSPVPTTYDPKVMADIDDWVRTEGKTLMFIYGSNDPWTAGAFTLGDAEDSHKFIVPNGNHNSKIAGLPTETADQARAIVRRWAGVAGKPEGKPLPGERLADPRDRRRPL